MKKILGVLTIVIIGFAGFVGFKGYQYYNNTYKQTLAYAIVPEKIPEKEETVDTEGNKITTDGGKKSYTYKYTFDFKKNNGSKQTIEYWLQGSDVKPFKPGERITATISKTRIIKGPFTTES